jgi:hypothetical protein
MPQTEKQKTLQRWGSLKNERASWFAHYKDLSTYILPRNGRYFVEDRNRGQKRNNNIYDSTASRAAGTLAAGMMAGMTSPARPWFRLATADEALMQYGSVKVWCSEVTKLMLRVFQNGNTYRTLHTMYEELGVFGTAACVLLEDFDDVIRFYPLTAGEYCIATDGKGNVNTLYREFQMTVAQLVDEFGIENVSLGVKNMHRNGTLDAWVTVVQGIEPRIDRDPSKKDAKNKAWKSCYFEITADNDSYLREGGYDFFPVLAPRWATQGGDIYGNSPGMMGLGDIKQLQHQQLRKAQAIDYQTKPPLILPTSMKSHNTNTLPGGIMYMDSPGGNPGIRSAFEANLNLQHLLGDMQEVRMRINATFFADMFLMLANSTNPQMTATEVAERHEEKLLMLGPVLERLNDELLNPMIEMTFRRMDQAGLLPPPPPELDGVPIDVEFVSMLAQAQRAVGTNSTDRFINAMGAVAQAKPEVLDKLNVDAWADMYSESLGVDPTIINDETTVAAIRKQRADAQAAAQQAAMMQQTADTAKTLAQAPTDGGGSNALDDVIGMFSGYQSSGAPIAQ